MSPDIKKMTIGCRSQSVLALLLKSNSNNNTKNQISSNILEWISEEAPSGVVPQILSFLGSRKLLALSKVNSKWRRIILSEVTWRTMCEDTGKWKEGDILPRSWLELYRNSPCVPMDYNSIESALAAVTSQGGLQRKTVRILLRPATYILSDSLVICAAESTQVTIETLQEPSSISCALNHFANNKSLLNKTIVAAHPPSSSNAYNSESVSSRNNNRKLSKCHKLTERMESLRHKLLMKSCLYVSPASGDGAPLDDCFQQISFIPPFSDLERGSITRTHHLSDCQLLPRATLVFQTRKKNKPLIHVQQGLLNLNNLNLVHYSSGADIWRGNAAMQIQPQCSLVNGQLVPIINPFMRQPIAVLSNVDVTSRSGRGVVAVDGGKVIAKKSCVHHCAATGFFVAGVNSEATVEQCDIIFNGCGNRLSSRGIARGHSGIFVAQGYARVLDSNVSNNTLTGITPAQSVANVVIMHIENSELIENGVTPRMLP